MSNKSKRKQEERAHQRAKGLRRRTLLWLAPVGGVGLVAYAAGWRGPFGSDPKSGRSFHVKGGERAPVLDPFQFTSANVRRAYLAAQQHPEALDQVYCYCNCDRPPTYHKSLLSCFTDFHGAG